MRRVLCLVFGLVSAGADAAAQGSAPRPAWAPVDLSRDGRIVVEVPIGDQGVGEAAFTNPETPADLTVLGPASTVELRFQNVSSADVDIEIGRTRMRVARGYRTVIGLPAVRAAVADDDIARAVVVRADGRPLARATAFFRVAAAPGAAPKPVTTIVDGETKRTTVRVPIREDGIGDPAFLNSASPVVLPGAGANEATTDLEFRNLSLTTDFTIHIANQTLALRQNALVSVTVSDLRRGLLDPRGTFEVRSPTGPIPNGVGYFLLSEAGTAPTGGPDAVAPVQLSDPQSRVPAVLSRTRRAAMPVTPPPVTAPTQPAKPTLERLLQIPLNGVGVDDWEYRNLRNPPYLLTPAAGENGDAIGNDYRSYIEAMAEALPESTLKKDVNEGIARIARSFNEAQVAQAEAARDPDARVNAAAATAANPWTRLALLEATEIEFVNDAVDRTFTVTFEIPVPLRIATASVAKRPVERAEFEKRSGLRLGDCGSGSGATCKVLITVPYHSPRRFGARWLAGEGLDAEGRLDFITRFGHIEKEQGAVTFSVSFFDENATPAEPSAYVSLVPLSSLREPGSKTTWSMSATIGAAREPLIADDARFWTEGESRYDGELKRVFSGTSKITLKQTLGSRADAVVDFAFKSGVLGEKGYSGSVSTPMYQVNINSVPGLRLSFGKFLFANPVNGIAIRESGEGFRISARNKVSFSHLIRRESLDGAADTSNRDSKVYLLEARNLSGRRVGFVRSLNLLGLFGQDRAPATKHQYWTVGFDTQFSVPDSAVYGSMAYFHSERKPLGGQLAPPILAGKGDVAFVSVGYAFFQPTTSPAQSAKKVAATIRAEWGMGRGDSRETPGVDESYLGETSAFAPDAFFLTTMANKLARTAPVSGGAPPAALPISGLRGKQYWATVYQEERFTPLQWIVRSLGVPKEDIGARVLRGGARFYYFNGGLIEDDGPQAGGIELFTDSEIETPAGVKASIGLSYFGPGAAVKGYFSDRSIFTIVSKITVTLGS